MRRGLLLSVIAGSILGTGLRGSAADSASSEVPASFQPFEHMIGSWKGTAVPAKNRLKGWRETHRWAWKFAKGHPVGMSLELTGNPALAKGELTAKGEKGSWTYELQGTDPKGKPVVLSGQLDDAGRQLVLERVGEGGEGKDRWSLRLNSNQIRYTLDFDHQEQGAPQFTKGITVGLTKEGESFAAGGESANLPKCILTGGASTMTVSYKGKSYPICCSGCRDEFNEDPEKYVKKAALLGVTASGKEAMKPSPRRSVEDDSFDGLTDPPASRAKSGAAKAKADAKSSTAPKAAAEEDAEKSGTDEKAAAATRAATQLRLGQSLEKAGRTPGAIQYYNDIVKRYPGTPQAKIANERLEALRKK